MKQHIPVIGGVRDGDIITIPVNAQLGFQVILEQNTAKPLKGEVAQTSPYTLLEDLAAIPPRALVLDGMRWPIITRDGAPS